MTYLAILFLPLLASVLCGLLGCGFGWRSARFIPTLATLICAGLSLSGFANIKGSELYILQLFDFIHIGALHGTWGLYIDTLTRVMTAVVCCVSCLVHVYSLGYMAHDRGASRFFCYLSLFTFAMLSLVMASNFLQLFFGWEGVGLASYLLIGFWFEKESANAASIKAFVVNRVGDIGLIVGIALIFHTFHSVAYSEVLNHAGAMRGNISFLGYELPVLDAIGIALFLGAMGKSAQFLLHTWLPDAMEGPTPVSALIHAATMVTAGVFLVARCHGIYEHAPLAQGVIMFFGATTTFLAATIALVQNDIKRVIAYSTCSQLGYMFMAMACKNAYGVGIFHLFTHAFFKALLFLGAGSVIHATHHEQDMRNMGGLYKKLPFTWLMMLVGTLSITGFPLTAGYYSKDAIIEAIYVSSNPFYIYGLSIAVASVFLTSFYSWRLIFMVFHGRTALPTSEHDHDQQHALQPVPLSMSGPLLVLSVPALLAGTLLASNFIGKNQAGFWKGMFIFPHPHVPHFLSLLVGGLMLSGLILAWLLYVQYPRLPGKIASSLATIYTFLVEKWYFDAIYQRLFVKMAFILGEWGWFFDRKVIDSYGPNAAWRGVQTGAQHTSFYQTGYVRHYAAVMLFGAFALLTYIVFRN